MKLRGTALDGAEVEDGLDILVHHHRREGHELAAGQAVVEGAVDIGIERRGHDGARAQRPRPVFHALHIDGDDAALLQQLGGAGDRVLRHAVEARVAVEGGVDGAVEVAAVVECLQAASAAASQRSIPSRSSRNCSTAPAASPWSLIDGIDEDFVQRQLLGQALIEAHIGEDPAGEAEIAHGDGGRGCGPRNR